MASSGKRAGSRRGAPPPRRLNPTALALCAGITFCVIAWGYLVYAAIDFGTAARGGDGAPAWGLLALASLGAIACLFFGLMLVARLMRNLGIMRAPDSSGESAPAAPEASGASGAPAASVSDRLGPWGDSPTPGPSLGAAPPPAAPAAPPAPPGRTSHAAPHGTPHGPRQRGGKRAAR